MAAAPAPGKDDAERLQPAAPGGMLGGLTPPPRPFAPTRFGAWHAPGADDMIGRFLARYGEWAWLEAVFIAGLLGDGARLLDVGAFVGTFGFGVAAQRRLGHLCFVEANPDILPMLQRNAAARGGTVIAALVGAPGMAARPGRAEPGNLSAMSYAEAGEDGRAPAGVTTLQALRDGHGPFDLVKLDAEGMELEILRADADQVRTGPELLWVECNENLQSLEVAAFLLEAGRQVFYYAWPSFSPTNVRGDPEPVFPCAHEAGLLALPPGAPSPAMPGDGLLLPIRAAEDLRAALWRTPRWGLEDWAAASPTTLQALAGRYLCGETYDTFLRRLPPGVPPHATGWQQLEAALARAEAAEAALARLG